MSHREYQELFKDSGWFTPGTRTCLERSVGRALFGRKSDPTRLRSAVHRATRELRVQGLDVTATLGVLGAFVENAGRGCGADRSSLLSGDPLWMLVQTRVLESARDELTQSMA
jgi:hypothetical protein